MTPAERVQERSWRHDVLRSVLNVALGAGSLLAVSIVVLATASAPEQFRSPPFWMMMGTFACLFPVRFVALPYPVRAFCTVTIIALINVFALLAVGTVPGPFLGLCLSVLAAGLFLGRVALFVSLIATSLAVAAIGFSITSGWVAMPANTPFFQRGYEWGHALFGYASFTGTIALLVDHVLRKVRAAEQALEESRKLEALGRLAGGIAHDFNNSLQIILGWADLLRDGADPARVGKASDAIGEEAARAGELTRQLLAFGRRDVFHPTRLQVRAVIDSREASIRRLLSADVTLVVEHCDAPDVSVDASQLQQALLNLVINARDAMPTGGTLRLLTDTVAGGDASGGTADRSLQARVRIVDTGPGMSDDVRARMFEPFFTTKGAAGTGLGLAIAYGIVQRNGGELTVDTAPGRGTTFTIRFPGLPPGPQRSDGGEAQRPASRVRGRTVLIAEDEDEIRRSLVRTLRRAGFSVHEADGGDEAMALVEAHGDSVDVLVSDGIMPGAPARQVIARFLEVNPDGAVLICSGHLEEELVHREITADRRGFLAKPFAPETLVERIDRLLAGRGRIEQDATR